MTMLSFRLFCVNICVSYPMADDIYVVEKIISRRVTESGQVEYFLKWFGYDEDDATWEPEENVFCKDLIEQYEYRRKIARDFIKS